MVGKGSNIKCDFHYSTLLSEACCYIIERAEVESSQIE